MTQFLEQSGYGLSGFGDLAPCECRVKHTEKCRKLARPKRFELLTPRFVVSCPKTWAPCASRIRSLNRRKKTSRGLPRRTCADPHCSSSYEHADDRERHAMDGRAKIFKEENNTSGTGRHRSGWPPRNYEFVALRAEPTAAGIGSFLPMLEQGLIAGRAGHEPRPVLHEFDARFELIGAQIGRRDGVLFAVRQCRLNDRYRIHPTVVLIFGPSR